MKLRVSEIQRFCMHDGPGLRTTVFLKGCPLRCAWCHNPETQSSRAELLFYSSKCIACGACASVCTEGAHGIGEKHTLDREKCTACGVCAELCPTCALELCGKDMSFDEIFSVIEKDRAFYGELGGVTLSGGEPLMQKDSAVSFLAECKARGFSTAIETCGYADSEVLRAALPYVDLFLWDIKDTDSERHKKYTGVGNESILKNLSIADQSGARIRLRCILVNSVNTDEAHYTAIAKLEKSLRNSDGIELLPYHAYGGTKAQFIGGENNGVKEWIPKEQQIDQAKLIMKALGANVI